MKIDKPCVIASCRSLGTLWIGFEGYICERHADALWHRVEQRDSTVCDEVVQGAEGREYTRAECRAKRSSAKRQPDAMGQVYFVLVDGLVKVGWSSKLADRIRAYGPKATLLVNYPGTRADESNLHRQLTPARFKGREWYHDNDIVRGFVKEALATYGPPRFTSLGWTEPKQIVAGKRHH